LQRVAAREDDRALDQVLQLANVAKALNLPLFDSDAKSALLDFNAGQHPSKANGLIGADGASLSRSCAARPLSGDWL